VRRKAIRSVHLWEKQWEHAWVERSALLLVLQTVHEWGRSLALSMAPQSALPMVPQTARQSAKQWVWQRVLL
jgi:hypothetical protein